MSGTPPLPKENHDPISTSFVRFPDAVPIAINSAMLQDPAKSFGN